MPDDPSGGGWFNYSPGADNPHLSDEQRELVERRDAELAGRRGPQVARVVVDVYSSGEAVPHVQLLASDVDITDSGFAAQVVAQASAALVAWR